ncbi:MAG TPA: transglutaminase-like domain-containing protein [Motilibacterales bacterium]|nr:transglutaminase-like domain-containing protein [Motilibacterales bacterium]
MPSSPVIPEISLAHDLSPADPTGTPLRPVGTTVPVAKDVAARYIRPLAGREIRGVAWVGADLLVLDAPTGRIALVNPGTDGTQVVNDPMAEPFVGAGGLALDDGMVWFTTAAGLHRARWSDPTGDAATPRLAGPELVLPLEGATAVAVRGSRVHLVRGRTLEVREVSAIGTVVASVELHGIGAKGIAATADALWLCDDLEQTVYCLDPVTLATRFMVVTPLERPTAIAARRVPGDASDTLHVAYYENEPYLKDNPWVDPSWEVRYRDRALIHQLRVHHDPVARRAWSTGHRIQMHYYVDLEPDADVEPLADVQWRMSLPIESPRQRMVSVEPIGLPFELVEEAGQPVAVFTIPRVDAGTRLILGWRATLEVFSIKHLLSAADLADAPALSPEMAARYLIDDEDLDLDSPEIAEATAIALGDETNVLEQARRLRSYVYDRLSYEMGNADSPIGVLARGSGSCGEHVGTIMALYRRAGLACRVAGRYKSPYHPWSGAPLYPDFNHVWVDLYLPGLGWVPVESNPDGDVVDVGPYPDRFFLGLPWRHVEVGKDISFEKVTYAAGRRRRRIGARRLSRNHIRFDILAEIAPGDHSTLDMGHTVTSRVAGAPIASTATSVSPATG